MLSTPNSLSLRLSPLLLLVMFISCSDKDDPKPEAQLPSIVSISPESGPQGTLVTITGTNFNATAAANEVKINGMTAPVTSASPTALVVEVPSRAGDGVVTLTMADTVLVGPTFDYQEVYTVSTLAGSSEGYADGVGAAAQFNWPGGIAADASGNLFVADFYNHRIRKITPAGEVSTFAGTGVAGFADGAAASAQFNGPAGLDFDNSGNLYVTDFNNQRVRKITPAGEVSTLAGSGVAGFANGAGADAKFNSPNNIVADASGDLFVADSKNNMIRRISQNGEVTTFAGSGVEGYANGTGTDARLNWPVGLTQDEAGNLYVGEIGNQRIRKITPAGEVSTLAGRGVAGFVDGPASSAEFNRPTGLAMDAWGNLYIADFANNRIRRVSPAGDVTTVAGTGVAGAADGDGNTAEFNGPSRIMVNADGHLYVSDRGNHRIRYIQVE